MAITQTQNLPAPFIQGLGEEYAKGLGALTGTAMPTAQFAPAVAAQDPLQQQAATLAGQIGGVGGVGAYAPYMAGAQQAMGYDPAAQGITAAGYGAALDPYQQVGTPYQQDVLQASLDQFDQQKFAQEQAIRDKAVQYDSLGAGRTGVQLGQYQAQSDLDRASLGAGLRMQGYQQAQQAAKQGYDQLTGLPQTEQTLRAQGIGTLGQVGAAQQAQTQAVLNMQREANRMAAYEPYERLGFLGQGLTGLMGGYPQQYTSTIQPDPSPLASALGIGSTLGGLFGNIYGTGNK
jgi:hypothetical protein|tara:strand:- start:281 stop:1150 length:870 start_codon:yes stop_codon:yes gene_type:complete